MSSSSSSSTLRLCRICHEEEEREGDEDRETAMEAPCACSGTLKFAHRDCIQRWCDEKGNTVCEICLQKFEPGYSVPVKKALIEVGVTIRESSEVPRWNYGATNAAYAEHAAACSLASERAATACRYIIRTLTVILLTGQLVSLNNGEAEECIFGLFAVFALRACGILLPVYVLMSAIKSIQYSQRQQLLMDSLHERNGSQSLGGTGEDEILQHHVIQIHS